MKQFASIFIMLTVALTLAGCGGGNPKTKLDTKELQEAFASSDAKSQVDSAATALNSGNFSGGLTTLVEVANGELSTDQLDAMFDILTQVQKIMAEDQEKSDEAAWTATRKLSDLLLTKEQ